MICSYSTKIEGSLLSAYKARVAANSLEYSDNQFKVLRYLSRLSDYLESTPRIVVDIPDDSEGTSKAEAEVEARSKEESAGTIPEEVVKEAIPIAPLVKGIYIHGGVGVGKTMLMDLFFANCGVHERWKRRVHLHNFLLEIHARIHRFKQNLLETQGRDVHVDLDPRKDAISNVAVEVARETWLLAFDEFEVTNVADALILSKFFRVLWERGTVVVATSNRAPPDLYKHGLNREYFLPFISLLQRHSTVREVRGTDFRSKVTPCPARRSLYTDQQALWEAFEAQGEGNGGLVLERGVEVPIEGSATRMLALPAALSPHRTHTHAPETGRESTTSAAWSSFSDLCVEGERGASDFHALVTHYPSLYLHSVPQLSVLQHDAARRFVVLVDILYDSHTRLVWSSEHEPSDLFRYFEEEEEWEGDEEEAEGGAGEEGSASTRGKGGGPSAQWVTPSFALPPDSPEARTEPAGTEEERRAAPSQDGTYSPLPRVPASGKKKKNLRGAEQLTRTWRLREARDDVKEGREQEHGCWEEDGEGMRKLRSRLSDSCVQPSAQLALSQPTIAAAIATEIATDPADTLMVLEGEVSSVRELLFAFRRASSRLTEMRGAAYLDEWERRQRG